jgi:hypothetical protein
MTHHDDEYRRVLPEKDEWIDFLIAVFMLLGIVTFYMVIWKAIF